MLAQEFFQLIGIEIREHMIARDKCRHIGLLGELLHFLVRLSIFADVDLGKLKAARFKLLFGVDAPRTPFAAIKL